MCQMQLSLFNPVEPTQVKRSFELVQRTNQLNLSGRRYEEDDFREILKKLGKRALAATASDRFGSYGQIAYCVIEALGNALFVREFAMSCRVMGKGIEMAFLSWLIRRANSLGLEYVVFKGVRTNLNGLLVRTLLEAGLTDFAIDEGQILLAVRTDDVLQDLDIVELDESNLSPIELFDLSWEDDEGFPYILSATERELFGGCIAERQNLAAEVQRLQGEVVGLQGEVGALHAEIDGVYNSKTMKAGRLVTYVPRVVRDALGRLRGLGGDDSAEVANQEEPVLQSEQELSEQPAAAAADEPIASGEEGGRTAIPVGAAMTAFSIDDAPRDFLFFVPRQDDEMLTFGIGIIQAVRAGHRVHVILCTDGGLDGTRVRLASGGECELNTLEGGKYRREGTAVAGLGGVSHLEARKQSVCHWLAQRP